MDDYFRDWQLLAQRVMQSSRERVDAAQQADAFNDLPVYQGAVADAKMHDHALSAKEIFQAFEES